MAHEEQLSDTTTLCKQEMRLLMELRQGQKVHYDCHCCASLLSIVEIRGPASDTGS